MIPMIPRITIATKIIPATKKYSFIDPTMNARNASPSPAITNFCILGLRLYANFLAKNCMVIRIMLDKNKLIIEFLLPDRNHLEQGRSFCRAAWAVAVWVLRAVTR